MQMRAIKEQAGYISKSGDSYNQLKNLSSLGNVLQWRSILRYAFVSRESRQNFRTAFTNERMVSYVAHIYIPRYIDVLCVYPWYL